MCRGERNDSDLAGTLERTQRQRHGWQLEIKYEGNWVGLTDGRLGADGWSIPEAALAQGCGGEYESYVNEAIDRTLQGYNHADGITLLSGSLYESVAETAKEYLEEGRK